MRVFQDSAQCVMRCVIMISRFILISHNAAQAKETDTPASQAAEVGSPVSGDEPLSQSKDAPVVLERPPSDSSDIAGRDRPNRRPRATRAAGSTAADTSRNNVSSPEREQSLDSLPDAGSGPIRSDAKRVTTSPELPRTASGTHNAMFLDRTWRKIMATIKLFGSCYTSSRIAHCHGSNR